MIVVDASVAAKWFLPEADSEAAQALLAGPRRLLAPDLIRIEVAAAITRQARLGRLSADRVRALVAEWAQALADGAITLTPARDDIDGAAELAIQLRHPLQDCLYLALALRLDVPIVTADRAFINRARTAHPRIEDLRVGPDG